MPFHPYDFGDEEHICDLPKWHPSIHMPKEAARIFLRVTGVRIERLQDISVEDIKHEGVLIACKHCTHINNFCGEMVTTSENCIYYGLNHKEFFIDLWNSTIKPADLGIYGWNANPWVWVYEFERVNVE